MPDPHPLPRFLGRTTPVEIVSRLLTATVSAGAVVLRCATERYQPVLADYYGTEAETVFQAPGPGAPVTIRLDVCTPEIVRLRLFSGSESAAAQTPMVVGRFDNPAAFVLEEDDRSLTVVTAAVRLVIVREPFQIKLFGTDGALVFSTSPVDHDFLRRQSEAWHPAQQRWLFLHRYAYPLGRAVDGPACVFASFDLGHDEHIYGLGEGFGPLDKRGTLQELWLREAFSNASPGSYKQAPFYLSSRGYGLFVNTSNHLRVRVGDLEHTTLSIIVDESAEFDAYLIYGPRLQDILPRYTAITGAPGVPPKWSFGLWMGRISYRSQAEVEAVAHDLRAHRIPCDVIHIDTDWYEREWECDLQFGASKFPDPAGMLDRLRSQGFRVSLWQWPNITLGNALFEEGSRRGLFARRPNGQVYLRSGFAPDAALIDYSNPEAVEWIQARFRTLFELGVAAIKTDFGEGAPTDALYHGVASESMHNLYPLLYNQAIMSVAEEFAGPGRGVVWSRSAWAGSQRYPVHWSGDGLARFADLPCVLRAALSFGLSGFPFYSHDVGGFTGAPSPELYVRWSQFGFFSSHVRAHGVPPREPWAFGERAEAVFRQYAELRYRLLPYIYSEAVKCGSTSLPLVRPLVLEDQADPNTATIDDEYLFGDNLLVAPILAENNRRRVYLPRGGWVDYWSKQPLTGGRWIDVDAPLERLPLYVRSGAIVPYGPVMAYVDERPCDPLTLELYGPARRGGYVIHDQDRPDVGVAYQLEGDRLRLDIDPTQGRVELVVYGVTVTAAADAHGPHTPTTGDDGGVRLGLDGRSGCHLEMTVSAGVGP